MVVLRSTSIVGMAALKIDRAMRQTRAHRDAKKRGPRPSSFDRGVFINCPLDEHYLPLLRPLLFTVVALGFEPRLAIGRSDAGETRIQKIIELIRQSRFSIHDLSPCRAQQEGEFFRLNMPLELGLDHGCKVFKSGKWAQKRSLVMETERYRFQAAISDLSGSDILAHSDEPEEVVRVVRDWLVQEASAPSISASKLYGSFNEFMAANYDLLTAAGYSKRDIARLPTAELQTHMEDWVAAHL
jgi:hypothetical protein